MSIERRRYPLPKHSIDDRRFDAATLQRDSSWQVHASSALCKERSLLAEWASDAPDCIANYEHGTLALPEVNALAEVIRQKLDSGFGLVWIRNIPIDDDFSTSSLLYLALGMAMGEVDKTYGLLYDVVDLGESYKQKAIPVSQTRDSTGMHTDSSRLENVPDYIGLLCLRQGQSGGSSKVVSAVQVHEVLRHRSSSLLEILYQDFIRDIVTPGADRDPKKIEANRFPIFCYKASLTMRYMRYWIERGHLITGVPLLNEEISAMDALDEELSRNEHVFRFQLLPGDMLWVANRVVAHDRDAYTENVEYPRWLQRQWVRIQ